MGLRVRWNIAGSKKKESNKGGKRMMVVKDHRRGIDLGKDFAAKEGHITSHSAHCHDVYIYLCMYMYVCVRLIYMRVCVRVCRPVSRVDALHNQLRRAMLGSASLMALQASQAADHRAMH